MSGPFEFDDVVNASTTRRRFLQTLAVGVGASVLLGPSASAMSISQPRKPSKRLPTALVYDDMSRCHVSLKPRFECPERYDAVLESLKKSDYFSTLKTYRARPATDEEILACHSTKYLRVCGGIFESGRCGLAPATPGFARSR